jgi:hypothetical protein
MWLDIVSIFLRTASSPIRGPALGRGGAAGLSSSAETWHPLAFILTHNDATNRMDNCFSHACCCRYQYCVYMPRACIQHIQHVCACTSVFLPGRRVDGCIGRASWAGRAGGLAAAPVAMGLRFAIGDGTATPFLWGGGGGRLLPALKDADEKTPAVGRAGGGAGLPPLNCPFAANCAPAGTL